VGSYNGRGGKKGKKAIRGGRNKTHRPTLLSTPVKGGNWSTYSFEEGFTIKIGGKRGEAELLRR